MGNPMTRTTGCRLPWDHTVLPATRHKRTHPALTPASEGWYSIYLPRRDGRLSWLRCPDDAPTRSLGQISNIVVQLIKADGHLRKITTIF